MIIIRQTSTSIIYIKLARYVSYIISRVLNFSLNIHYYVIIEPDKNNQDSFSITSACVKNKADSDLNKLYIGYYGVYDGHGKQGDLVSYYTRDNVSSLLLLYVYILRYI